MTQNQLQRTLAEYYDAHAAALLAYARSLGAGISESEDALHSVFQQLHKQLLAGRSVAFPKAYLYQSLKRFLAELFQKQQRQKPLRSLEWKAIYEEKASGEMEGGFGPLLETSMSQLPEEQREALELHYIHGLTYEEISSALEIPLNTALSRGRLGLEKLRHLMGD